MKLSVLLVCMIVLFCTSNALDERNYSVQSVERIVKGNKVFINDNLYAELIFIGSSKYADCYRGISLYYVDRDEYEWISPKEGWKLQKDGQLFDKIEDVQKKWGDEAHGQYIIFKGAKKVGGDSYFKLEWRCNVKISKDGTYVSYEEHGLFGNKKRKHKIKGE